ncbi:glycosyltransferase family 4 protein [Brachybacterium halotolerans subsp. kimchii]|uniref:glycosyltransferase n=1 Tax=Brachybacterium halotolerans TaxID=2795215 RepID=UPI001E30CF6C|nr:glycosyltransferase [Brachybacterium halotolerans]UEJ81126.1 glycosyltransferase family 4 protein [Brachybacterium halotolerans subsp. kimchii]
MTPSLPVSTPLHAGGMLQRDVTRSLAAQGAQVLVLAPAFRSSLEVLDDVDPGCTVVMPELIPSRSSARGVLVRLSHRVNGLVARSPLQPAHVPFLVALLMQPRVWRALRSADVIDLQWFPSIRLRPLIRLLAGHRPVIIGTFHDVVSQRLERSAQVEPDPRQQARLNRAGRRARRLERRLGRTLHESVVLSEKDRGLLTASGAPQERVTVLAPHLEAPGSRCGRRPRRAHPTVIFVGYLLRLENHEAAMWLIREIWPYVHASVPEARLRIVGGGAKPELRDEVARQGKDVELTGFVDDLWAQYDAADCSVVPLRDGAGVKFKTIESLLAGLPTVATTIGAEGVGEEEDFVIVADEAQTLAEGIIRALDDDRELVRARDAAARLRAAHGFERFDSSVARIYRL